MYEYEIRNGVSQKDLFFLMGTKPDLVKYMKDECRKKDGERILETRNNGKRRINLRRKKKNIGLPKYKAGYGLPSTSERTS